MLLKILVLFRISAVTRYISIFVVIIQFPFLVMHIILCYKHFKVQFILENAIPFGYSIQVSKAYFVVLWEKESLCCRYLQALP